MKIEIQKAERKHVPILAKMNKKLIEDEGHSNPMDVKELTQRMGGFLKDGYLAYLFVADGKNSGYCLYRDMKDYIYIRQFYVERGMRRKGLGAFGMKWMKANLWSKCRLRMEVLTNNKGGIEFWHKLGFQEYCLTMESTA